MESTFKHVVLISGVEPHCITKLVQRDGTSTVFHIEMTLIMCNSNNTKVISSGMLFLVGTIGTEEPKTDLLFSVMNPDVLEFEWKYIDRNNLAIRVVPRYSTEEHAIMHIFAKTRVISHGLNVIPA